MQTFALLSAALLASKAYALANLGSAIVTNQCAYKVHLWAVPAAGGGFKEQDGVLATGESFTQQWTQLTNNAGWSIKLSKSADISSILQYEYTYQGDSIIWYDLSDVNGNPFNGDWEITANGNCVPRQAAYRYATDDAYGMQACNANSTITVTLCSGDDAATTTSVPVAAPASSTAAASTVQAATTTRTSTIAATLTSAQTTFVTSVVVTSAEAATNTAAPAASTTSTRAATNTRTWWRHRPTARAEKREHVHGHRHAGHA